MLVAVDHRSAAANVVDALTDEVPCLQLVEAWASMRRWHAHHLAPGSSLRHLRVLIPADNSSEALARLRATADQESASLHEFMTAVGREPGSWGGHTRDWRAARDLTLATQRVGRLPVEMQLMLGLLCVAEAATNEGIGAAVAQPLAHAVADCASSWELAGQPSVESRRTLRELMWP